LSKALTLEDFMRCVDDANEHMEDKRKENYTDLEEFRRKLGLPP
jgi:hypothetical protein